MILCRQSEVTKPRTCFLPIMMRYERYYSVLYCPESQLIVADGFSYFRRKNHVSFRISRKKDLPFEIMMDLRHIAAGHGHSCCYTGG